MSIASIVTMGFSIAGGYQAPEGRIVTLGFGIGPETPDPEPTPTPPSYLRIDGSTTTSSPIAGEARLPNQTPGTTRHGMRIKRRQKSMVLA